MNIPLLYLASIYLSSTIVAANKDDAEFLYDKIFTSEDQALELYDVYKSLGILDRFYRGSDELESLIKAHKIREILDTAFTLPSKCNDDNIRKINWLIKEYKNKVNIAPLLNHNLENQLRVCYEEGFLTKNGKKKIFFSRKSIFL